MGFITQVLGVFEEPICAILINHPYFFLPDHGAVDLVQAEVGLDGRHLVRLPRLLAGVLGGAQQKQKRPKPASKPVKKLSYGIH